MPLRSPVHQRPGLHSSRRPPNLRADDVDTDAVTAATPEVRGTESGTIDKENGTAICRTIAHRVARNEKTRGKPGFFAAKCVDVRLVAKQPSTP